MRALPARERALYTTLISAIELAAALAAPNGVGGNLVRLIDCRARLDDAGFGARAYAAGHLPSAVFASLEHDLSATPGAGGRHPLPSADRLAARLRDLGSLNGSFLNGVRLSPEKVPSDPFGAEIRGEMRSLWGDQKCRFSFVWLYPKRVLLAL